MAALKLSELIFKRMNELVLTPKQVVKKMGYTNISKSLRRLAYLLDDALIPDMYPRIVSALEITNHELDDAIKETRRQEKSAFIEAEKKAFRPHILAMCELHTPSPIFVGSMTFSLRFIYLEDGFLNLSFADQIEVVKPKIREHNQIRNNQIIGFRNITHYVLRRYYDEKKEDVPVFFTNGELNESPGEDLERFLRARPSGMHLK